ncbi:DUF3298 and DUF4163 domain-containing protein [Chlorobium phaeobacteroides]|uniref:DUF3298 domain-containing protein n=1 Tax=Chlorobium phaeobacteroides (strain DSM 266 / SMG 266 / 2430) TaxID=290317 RepID=A1BEI6_CHLPD|nr:DUF3298 and DUF4163 domain-containing protein [Chlorobium phaeobacteroides]ABL64813.1 conserved hypothetical protein [Chlorobium phaeobacteroides DSM 266]
MKDLSTCIRNTAAFIFILFVLSAANVGCSPEKSSLPLSYEMKRIEKFFHEGKTKEDRESYCKCNYPVFSGRKNAEAINNHLQQWIADSTAIAPGKNYTGSKSIETLSDNFLKEYERVRKDFPVNWPYVFMLDGSVLLNRSGLLSIDLSSYSFTGGAHGSSHTEYFVFDTLSGDRLKLKDVFEERFENALNTLIEKRYREMKGLSPSDKLNGEKGELFENFIHFNNNFALTDKGVSFLYNQYEIAARPAGTIEVDLSYGELSAILKPRFRVL